jgi:hypothetical protein
MVTWDQISPREKQVYTKLLQRTLDNNFKGDYWHSLNELGSRVVRREFADHVVKTAGMEYSVENKRNYYGEFALLTRALGVPNIILTGEILAKIQSQPGAPLHKTALAAAALAQERRGGLDDPHANVVSIIAVAAAQQAGLNPQQQQLLLIAAQLHDATWQQRKGEAPARHEQEKATLKAFGIASVIASSTLPYWTDIRASGIVPGSPASRLKPEEGDMVAQLVLDMYLGQEDALKVRRTCAMDIFPGKTMRRIMVMADTTEICTLVGGGAQLPATPDSVRALRMLMPSGAPFLAMGLCDEARELIRRIEARARYEGRGPVLVETPSVSGGRGTGVVPEKPRAVPGKPRR